MKQQLNEKDPKVSPTQVLDYYSKQQKVEKEKIESGRSQKNNSKTLKAVDR